MKKSKSGDLRYDPKIATKYNPDQFHYSLDMSNEGLTIAKGSIIKIFGHNKSTSSELPMSFEVKKDTEIVIRSHETDITTLFRNMKVVSDYQEIEKQNQEHFQQYQIKHKEEVIKNLTEQVHWSKQTLERHERLLKEWKEKLGNNS